MDGKHEADLPKKLLLEAATQLQSTLSSPAPAPVAATNEEMGNEEARISDTSGIMHEEQKNATMEQGKLMNHQPTDEDPGDTSDPDRIGEEFRYDRHSQDADTASSRSSLSPPPESDDEQDHCTLAPSAC